MRYMALMPMRRLLTKLTSFSHHSVAVMGSVVAAKSKCPLTFAMIKPHAVEHRRVGEVITMI